MGKVYVSLSMSLDGFITGPDPRPGEPIGDGGERLHEWSASDGEIVRPSGPAARVYDEINATGAVLTGRRTAEQVDHWNGDHHGVPIFVPSHRPPDPTVAGYPRVTYVLDGIVSAMAQANAAASDRNVLVHGAYTAQRALEAGVLDELLISYVPVLLGAGRRLFDVLPSRIELEVVRVVDTRRAPTSATVSAAEPVGNGRFALRFGPSRMARVSVRQRGRFAMPITQTLPL